MKAPLSAAIAIAVGIILLAGYFVPLPLLQNTRSLLLGWAVILAGIAALVGIANLVRVHWQKATTSRGRDLYSFVLLLAFTITLVFGLIRGPGDQEYQKAVLSIQVPVEVSLMALVALSLAFAGLRLFSRRRGLMGTVFFLSAVFFLVLLSGLGSALDAVPVLGGVVKSLQALPLAGARGILIGIALGSLVTGVRILMGADRPYSG